MSVGAAETTGPHPRAGLGSEPGEDAPDLAGRVLAWITVLPALLATAWLLAGFVLLYAGHFTPVLTTVLAAVLAVPLVGFGLRPSDLRVALELPANEAVRAAVEAGMGATVWFFWQDPPRG